MVHSRAVVFCAVASDVGSEYCFIENVHSRTTPSPAVPTDPGNNFPITASGTSSKLATPPTGSDQDILPQGSGSQKPALASSKNQVTSDDGTDDIMDTAGSSMDEGEITDYSPETPTNQEANQDLMSELGHEQQLRELERTHEDNFSHATEFSGGQGVQDESMVDASAPDAPHKDSTCSSSGRSISPNYLRDGKEPPLAESSQEEGEIEMDDSDDYEPPEPASPAAHVEEVASPAHALPLETASSSVSAELLTEGVLQAALAYSPPSAEARQTLAAIIKDSIPPPKVCGFSSYIASS